MIRRGLQPRIGVPQLRSRCFKEHKLRLCDQKADNNGYDTTDDTLLTTPLFYVNGELHIGHAYTLVASDIIKLYNGISGRNSRLLSGTDEHGTKIENAAATVGKTPQRYVEHMRTNYMEVKRAYNLHVDIDVHTADENHREKVKQIFTRLLNQGDIYEGLHKGYFCPKEDAYYTEFQLVDGKSPMGFEVHHVAEKAFFFRLSKYQDRLRQLIGKHGYIVPQERQNEAMEMLRNGLPDVAVTRSNTGWGVPLDIKGFEGHTVYVWLDALLGYLPNYLQVDVERNMVMIFGKDILRFITLLWPALLMALGKPPPNQLICHGWILQDKEKMSKSKGGCIPALPPLSTPDVSRYVLMSLGAFGKDFHYDIETVTNLSEFVRDKYANLTHRVTSLFQQRGLSKVIHHAGDDLDQFVTRVVDRWECLGDIMRQFRIDKYIQEVNSIALDINNYITHNRIWQTQDTAEFKQHALVLCQALLALTIYLYPVMPGLARQNMQRLQPNLNGVPIEHGASVDILRSLKQIVFNPQHLGPLM
ncbi:putative methionyl-tRNA synthetase [Babesia divergens]|uniref:methionine--tRNA ligase n=1 Tax=Babesia divergens TaxID=32595 RepID=A0AAD9GJN1_BABDI|nr:putative methionyl-tRNA synthetase [Babesia divergens]